MVDEIISVTGSTEIVAKVTAGLTLAMVTRRVSSQAGPGTSSLAVTLTVEWPGRRGRCSRSCWAGGVGA